MVKYQNLSKLKNLIMLILSNLWMTSYSPSLRRIKLSLIPVKVVQLV